MSCLLAYVTTKLDRQHVWVPNLFAPRPIRSLERIGQQDPGQFAPWPIDLSLRGHFVPMELSMSGSFAPEDGWAYAGMQIST